MYCERCGKKIDEALNYCNGCGTSLKRETGSYRTVLTMMIAALSVVGVTGLGILIGLLAVLLDRVSRPEPVFAFAVFYLAAWFGVCFMMMRQISKLIDANIAGKISFDPEKSRQAGPPLVQLPPRTTAQLEEYRQPASVIENTTRTLDEVPVGKRA